MAISPRAARLSWIAMAAAIACPLLAAHGADASAPSGGKPVHLLFAGSSSTYFNDLPDAVRAAVDGRMAGAQRGRPVSAEIVGRSGDDIRVYSEPGFDDYQYGVARGQTFLEKVASEKPDYLVLMVVARFIMREDDGKPGHADAVTRYCEAARAAGGEPVFYEMGWGDGSAEDDGRQRIFDLAVENGIRVFAPCASAWARVKAERPELDLQHPRDRVHPGDVGHFLNLACFYAAFTRESPVGNLPRTYPVWPHWDKAAREAREAELDAALEAFEPTPYQAALPSWMRKNSAAGDTKTLDDETARYLELVAWETWQAVDSRLRAAVDERAN